MNPSEITIRPASLADVERVRAEWSELHARHLHIEDGFSLLAVDGSEIVGMIAVYWRPLPAPLSGVTEGYIDIIEVAADRRRQGIARALVEGCIARAKTEAVYQLRAWSSEDKLEAIPMWKALGFGLCPAVTYPRGQEVRGYYVTLPLG
ncbi:MAG: GNAT family N-acetyltransferase [Anaerolineaceae bacterium]|nr:GNAT family N-acetyltransferase [Anaerolineaceae bacterium]